VDSDHDGMPDSWETLNILNPKNAGDRNKVGEDGYTMLEKYLNSIN
jgi:pectate lyase